jgi:hypothetical protein
MLSVLDRHRLKEQEARHPKLGHDVPDFALFQNTQRDTLSVPINGLQNTAGIPSNGIQAFPHNIRPTDPSFHQPRAHETSTNLSGDNFCFRKFRHDRQSQQRLARNRARLGHGNPAKGNAR